jgi:hypothetical protein
MLSILCSCILCLRKYSTAFIGLWEINHEFLPWRRDWWPSLHFLSNLHHLLRNVDTKISLSRNLHDRMISTVVMESHTM